MKHPNSSINSIKVAVRCRPYTSDDRLGVHMVQEYLDKGEVSLLNYTGTKKRFAFTWSWWSAYGWQVHQNGDRRVAEDMKLIHQGLTYEATGVPIRRNVLDGQAVVRIMQFVPHFFCDSLLPWHNCLGLCPLFLT